MYLPQSLSASVLKYKMAAASAARHCNGRQQQGHIAFHLHSDTQHKRQDASGALSHVVLVDGNVINSIDM